jgi:uncharacterized membrane protein
MAKPGIKPEPISTPQEQLTMMTRQELHIRPIPSPDEMQQYEGIQQGFADRLLKMAEKEQDRRLKREDDLIELSRRSMFTTRLGLFLGFASVIALSSLCAYIAFLGDTKSAAAIATATMIGLAAVFVTGRVIQSKKNPEKG